MILYKRTENEYNQKFEDINDHYKIWVQCDYCSEEVKKLKVNILKTRKIIEKDTCFDRSCRNKKIKESNQKKYGVDCVFQCPEIIEKSKETCLEKYGVDRYAKHPDCLQKTIKTTLERYGVENASQSEVCQNKRKQTNLERYGVECTFNSEEQKIKTKITNLEKYGFESPTQSQEIQNKVKQTNLERHGVEYPAQSPEIYNKVKQTNLEKYGAECYIQTEEFKQKYKETCLEKYGVENYSQSEEILNKRKKTCLEKYGKTSYLASNEGINRRHEVYLKRYGTTSPIPTYGKTQGQIQDWLNSFRFNFQTDYTLLTNNQEIDLYDANTGVAFEYNGLYWHNEHMMSKNKIKTKQEIRNYHCNKFKQCKDKGVNLITIFEDEWLSKQEQCEIFIKSLLGIYETTISATDCEIQELSKQELIEFYENNGIFRSPSKSSINFGLIYENEIVAGLSLLKHKRNIEINKLCFKNCANIENWQGTLFLTALNWCKKQKIEQIYTQIDNRWNNSKIYTDIGFKFLKEAKPDYSYAVIAGSKYLIPKNNINKSEAKEQGLTPIWDCGKSVYAYDI